MRRPWVKEEQGILPFLTEDFAKGGVLNGKEVYVFSPSTSHGIEGDTIHFTLSVALPGQKSTTVIWVAKRAGVYPFVCAIQSHLPMIAAQLIVLPATGISRP